MGLFRYKNKDELRLGMKMVELMVMGQCWTNVLLDELPGTSEKWNIPSRDLN